MRPRSRPPGMRLDAISEAIEKAGYKGKVKLGMDAAASEFYKDGKYQIDGKSLDDRQAGRVLPGHPQATTRSSVFEDPFSEDDWDGFVAITKEARRRSPSSGMTFLLLTSSA